MDTIYNIVGTVVSANLKFPWKEHRSGSGPPCGLGEEKGQKIRGSVGSCADVEAAVSFLSFNNLIHTPAH